MTSPTVWCQRLARTSFLDLYSRSALKRLTASTTAGGMMLVGMPLMMEYVVRPGDTLSEIAQEHDTSVTAIVDENGLDPSGDVVIAGDTLTIPSAHGRGGGVHTPGPRPTTKQDQAGPDARKIVRYTVRPGDTPSGLAVRFHAWTAELIAMNGSVLQVGETIRIPVVLAAVAEERAERARKAGADKARPAAGPSHERVRRIIERTARRHGVDPQLALAISWQEAGWQMHHVSHANAIGAMQVIPGTGEWMSDVLGRDLDLYDVHDNVTAGVVLLRELDRVASRRDTVAGYYQGLAGVRSHGMYSDTKRYVANVLALKERFEQGNYPY